MAAGEGVDNTLGITGAGVISDIDNGETFTITTGSTTTYYTMADGVLYSGSSAGDKSTSYTTTLAINGTTGTSYTVATTGCILTSTFTFFATKSL